MSNKEKNSKTEVTNKASIGDKNVVRWRNCTLKQSSPTKWEITIDNTKKNSIRIEDTEDNIIKFSDAKVIFREVGGMMKAENFFTPRPKQDVNLIQIQTQIENLANEISILKSKNQQTFDLLKDFISFDTNPKMHSTGHIYLSTDNIEKGEDIYDKFKRFAESIGYKVVLEADPIIGSYIGRFVTKIKRFFSDKDFGELAEDAEHALKLAMIDKVQSEIDHNNATAAAALLESLKNTKSAVLQIGALVLIKHYDKKGDPIIITKTLHRTQMKKIAEKPQLLNSPQEMLDFIEEISIAEKKAKRAEKEIPGSIPQKKAS